MPSADPGLTPEQRAMSDLWDQHMAHEFETKSTESTMETMVDDAHVNHVPVMTGGCGSEEVSRFYSRHFISKMPPDVKVVPVSRTIGHDRLVDEIIFSFTHTEPMDWMLPGVEPTGRKVSVPLVVIVGFRDGKLESEHIYWDQASVLVQVGLLEPGSLPVAGAETARKILDPGLPSNELIEKLIPGA